MPTSPFIDSDGKRIQEKSIIGYGSSGGVVRCDNLAIKSPHRYSWTGPWELEENIGDLKNEQDAYCRFNSFPRQETDCIGACMELCTNATHLAFMGNRNFRAYSKKYRIPHGAVQLLWFCQMARALAQVHDKCVIVADVATGNFLIDADLSIKLCDFSNAAIFPLGTVMERADDVGYTVKSNIGQLGAAMCEVATG
ncbi:kinase-like domain-containing protein [Aspergillus varians]